MMLRPMLNNLFRNRVYPVDWIILAYCLLMVGFILLFGRPIQQFVDELFFFVGVARTGSADSTLHGGEREPCLEIHSIALSGDTVYRLLSHDRRDDVSWFMIAFLTTS